MSEIDVRPLNGSDHSAIERIATWYLSEWDTPTEKTIGRLRNQPSENTLVQLVAYRNGEMVGTGGLCHEVNLLNTHPKFKTLGPWVALLYTDNGHRHKGIGQSLLEAIELKAKALQFDTIYLYTFTAGSLYTRCGWKTIERIDYKDHPTAIMVKELK
ncbi:MAG: GNAT family N-acetyltransferase [Flavobacteriales bacterium]